MVRTRMPAPLSVACSLVEAVTSSTAIGQPASIAARSNLRDPPPSPGSVCSKTPSAPNRSRWPPVLPASGSYIAASSLHACAGQASHDVASSNLDSAFAQTIRWPGFSNLILQVLMHDLCTNPSSNLEYRLNHLPSRCSSGCASPSHFASVLHTSAYHPAVFVQSPADRAPRSVVRSQQPALPRFTHSCVTGCEPEKLSLPSASEKLDQRPRRDSDALDTILQSRFSCQERSSSCNRRPLGSIDERVRGLEHIKHFHGRAIMPLRHRR